MTRWLAVPLVLLAVLAQDTVTFRTVAKGSGESSVERRVAFTFREQGRQSSGGHSVRITQIDRTGDGWVVHVTEVSPGRGCIVTQQETRPYHVVRVPRTGEDVSFEYRRVKRDC